MASFDDATTVRSYRSLALVERAFRCIKSVDLQVRRVYHWLADRERADVFLSMLAYHLEWHMRERLAPMLFDDTDKQAAEALRTSEWQRRNVHRRGHRADYGQTRKVCRCIAADRCWPIWRRWRAIQSPPTSQNYPITG